MSANSLIQHHVSRKKFVVLLMKTCLYKFLGPSTVLNAMYLAEDIRNKTSEQINYSIELGYSVIALSSALFDEDRYSLFGVHAKYKVSTVSMYTYIIKMYDLNIPYTPLVNLLAFPNELELYTDLPTYLFELVKDICDSPKLISAPRATVLLAIKLLSKRGKLKCESRERKNNSIFNPNLNKFKMLLQMLSERYKISQITIIRNYIQYKRK